MRYQPSSWLDRLVGACFSLLVGSAAVYIAVKLVLAVWTALLIIIGVGVFLALAVAALRQRNRGW